MELWFLFVVNVLWLEYTMCAPNLVLTTTTPVPPKNSTEKKEVSEISNSQDLIIHEFSASTNISNRYAKTVITSRVKNPFPVARDSTFSVVLPEKAFISEFIMDIKGKSYKAYVKEKDEAKDIYNKAIAGGLSAGHVAVNARDSNRFTVSVNIESESKAVFRLSYEELLERKMNQYELVLNIHPGQIVKDLHVQVQINESRPLKFVRTPSLRSGNEISKNDKGLEPSSEIQIINATSAIVKFNPDVQQQKDFISELAGKENEGLTGQFVVQYDVERDPLGGEVLVRDGYFVHFFAPEDIEPLPEHIIFILDTSGSMYGTKLKQLKEAMTSILSELKEGDIFHIVEFNTYVYVWDIEREERVKVNITDDDKPYEDVVQAELPYAALVNKENIVKGKVVIDKLKDDGITNMLSSLVTGLHLTKATTKNETENITSHQPIVVFLTDGDPTAGIIDTDEITKIITELNSNKYKAPLFSLSFGDEADKYFLRKLSITNLGFSRHIYEAADASLQIQDFYKEISSPLLSNVHFKYDADVKQVSKLDFPIFFRGSELVTVGIFEGPFAPVVEAFGINGSLKAVSKPEFSVSSLERLWAYLTIKEKLQQKEFAENKTQVAQEALRLALQYSFVTDLSSLVVVKPNHSSAVNTVDASVTSLQDAGKHGSLVEIRFSEEDGYFAGFNEFDIDANGVYAEFYVHFENETGTPESTNNDTSNAEDLLYWYNEIMNISHALDISPNKTAVPKEPQNTTSDMYEKLPWLKEVLNPNSTLIISGNVYELGEQISYTLPPVSCPATPKNNTEHGQCILLKYCSVIYPLIATFDEYQKYFCPLENNKFAGICCPIEV